MNDLQTEDTDQPTNPWLELILESNKNEKEPTNLWNAVQDYVAEDGDLKIFSPLNYSHRFLNFASNFLLKLKLLDMHHEVNLSGLEIGNLNFKSAHFRFPISFKKTRFLQPANFGHAEFKSTVDFGSVQFDQNVYFEHADFGGHANFSNAKFGAERDKTKKYNFSFSAAKFWNTATFNNCKFYGESSFNGTLFGGVNYAEWNENSTYFYSCVDAEFHGKFEFSPSQSLHANFSGAEYFGQALFKEFEFQRVIFEDSTFLKGVKFKNVRFREGGNFTNAEINGSEFINCPYSGKFNFADAEIKGHLKLPSFDNTLNLRGTNFVNRPPELFGSDLKPDSDLAFTLPAKPNPNHINIYEDLRQHAERLGKLEEKKRFVHAELSCRAIDPQKSRAERFVWWLYYITSDYGTSIYRPLGWLFVLFLISAAPWLGYAIWFSPMSVWSSLSYNILQAVPFTGHLSAELLGSEAFENLPMSLHFIAGPVALLNPIFWFLIGLGMRYKLRLAR